MAKKKSKRAAAAGAAGVLAGVASDILGRAILNVANEGLGALGGSSRNAKSRNGKSGGGGRGLSGRGDPAATLLRTLADEGKLSIPDLLERTGGALSPLLRAMRDAREFGLVEWHEHDEVIEVTDAGRRLARTLKKGGIREAAGRLLES